MPAVLAAILLCIVSVPTAAQTFAFTDVNLVPMDRERVVAGQTVIVRDGRIVEAGPANRVAIPPGATRIDGRGKYLTPGLAEMHGHIPPPQAPAAVTEAFLALYVLRGATTVRTMFGFPNQFELKRRIAAGEILGPTIYTASPALSGNAVNGPEHGRQLVRDYQAAGYDLLKIHENLTSEEYEAIVATAKEVGIRYAGHVPNDVGVRRAIAAGQGIDHLDGYFEDAGEDPARIAELARLTAAARITLAPTMDLWKTLLVNEPVTRFQARPELRYVTAGQIQQWVNQKNNMNANAGDPVAAQRQVAARNRILKALQDAGANIVMGSDAPQVFSVPGFSLEHEAPAMAEAGLTPYQVLEAATRRAAAYFGHESEWGTIAPGRRADLLLLDGNPLEDVQNLHRQAGVMVRGQWLPKEEIDRRLEAIAARMRTA